MFAIICPLLRKTSLGIGSGEVEYTTNILGANLDAFALGFKASRSKLTWFNGVQQLCGNFL